MNWDLQINVAFHQRYYFIKELLEIKNTKTIKRLEPLCFNSLPQIQKILITLYEKWWGNPHSYAFCHHFPGFVLVMFAQWVAFAFYYVALSPLLFNLFLHSVDLMLMSPFHNTSHFLAGLLLCFLCLLDWILSLSSPPLPCLLPRSWRCWILKSLPAQDCLWPW